LAKSPSRPKGFDELKWNEWNSACHGYYRLGPGRQLEVFVTLNTEDPFAKVPRRTALEVLDRVVGGLERLVQEEPTIRRAAAAGIAKLLERARKRAKGPAARGASRAEGAEWKAVFFRPNAKYPIELQYEFDLATMTALGGRDLVLFVRSDLKCQKVQLRGG
jgi:hypothetical protein